MNVVILSRDGLLHKGLCDDLVSNLNRILVNNLEFGCSPVLEDGQPSELELL